VFEWAGIVFWSPIAFPDAQDKSSYEKYRIEGHRSGARCPAGPGPANADYSARA
jgi:hypothetical protein